MDKKDFFDIPYMRVHRDDVVAVLMDDNIVLSDEDMKKIASRMSDAIMEDWNINLRSISEDVLNEKR